VPDGGDRGDDGDVHHVVVEQDLNQSPEGPKANLAIEGKPRIINPAFEIYVIIVAMFLIRLEVTLLLYNVRLSVQTTSFN
jgi:hypothetical protein